jgi:hypothetical protein
MDFARLQPPCQLGFIRVFVVKIMVNLWWNHSKCAVAMHEIKDVHYLGLELSEFGQFQLGGEP